MNKTGKTYLVRLTASERVQHIIFTACFLVLVITGFMAKTPEELVTMLGTTGAKIFFLRGFMHRTAAAVFILSGLYFILFGSKSRRKLTTIVPKTDDFKDSVARYLYNLGIIDEPPRLKKPRYMNKFKHMAFILVGIIMSVTGIILWTEHRWSAFTLDVAILIHSMQAIFMCLVIALNIIGRSLNDKK